MKGEGEEGSGGGHLHHHAMEPSPLSNLSRLVPASETREMCRKGWTNGDSCFVDWTARGSLTFQSSVRKSLSDLRYLSAPAFPTSWLRISRSLSMPRPSPSPPTQTHARSHARPVTIFCSSISMGSLTSPPPLTDGRRTVFTKSAARAADNNRRDAARSAHAQRQRMPLQPTGPIQ